MNQQLVTIGNFPTTSVGIQQYIANIKDKILEGEISGGDAKCLLKSMEIIVKDLQDDKEIKEVIQDFADRYSEKTFTYKGMQFTKSEKKVYDFTDCGDVEYNVYLEKLEELKAKIKDKETFLKTLKEPISDLEGNIINPPTYKTTTILALKPL